MLALRKALTRGIAWIDRQLAHAMADAVPAGAPRMRALAEAESVLRTAASVGIAGAEDVLDRLLDVTDREHSEVPEADVLGVDLRTVLAAQQADGSFEPADDSRDRASAVASPEAGTAPHDPVARRIAATSRGLARLLAAHTPTFADPTYERDFWRDGYVVLDLLTPEDVAELRTAHVRIEGTSVTGFYSSWFRPLDVRFETDRQTRAVCQPRLQAAFPGHRMIFGTFMSKGCDGPTEFPIHQDPSLVDELLWTPITYWIPLVDVDVVNGCMHVAPGSHLLSTTPRPSYAQFAYPELQDVLRAHHLRPVPMRAGQVLAFHSALIHYSPANQTRSLRVATAGVLVPKGAELVFCRGDARKGPLREYLVDDSFYLRMQTDDPVDALPVYRESEGHAETLDLSALPRMDSPAGSPAELAGRAPLRSGAAANFSPGT